MVSVGRIAAKQNKRVTFKYVNEWHKDKYSQHLVSGYSLWKIGCQQTLPMDRFTKAVFHAWKRMKCIRL